jgi:hypothetical protein
MSPLGKRTTAPSSTSTVPKRELSKGTAAMDRAL